jgi:putative ABC transport system permease protein
MTIQDQIRTALANVGRRKLRSALASLGVVVGTLTIVIMVLLASGVRQQINRQFASIGLDRLTVMPPGGGRGGCGKRLAVTLLKPPPCSVESLTQKITATGLLSAA